jgi:hypothetical protein
MKKMKNDLGGFLAYLAQSAPEATAKTLEDMRNAAVAEQQAQIKEKVTVIFRAIQQQVAGLQEVRRREAAILKEIKHLEQSANDVVSGKTPEPQNLGDLLREKLAVGVEATRTRTRPYGY